MAYDRDAMLEIVFERISSGESLTAICSDKDMPSHQSIMNWLREENRFEEYARARECRADIIFDEVLTIADDITKSPDDRRIAIDARKWAAGKLHGKYNDKIKHVGGDVGDAPIKIIDYSRMSDAELSRIAESSES